MTFSDKPQQEQSTDSALQKLSFKDLITRVPPEIQKICQEIFDQCYSDEEEELLAVHMRDYAQHMNEQGSIEENVDTAPKEIQEALKHLYAAFTRQSAEKAKRVGKGTVGYVFTENKEAEIAIKTIHDMLQYFLFITDGRACTLREEHQALKDAYTATKHLTYRSVRQFDFTPTIPPRYAMERIKGRDLEWFSLSQSNLNEFPDAQRILHMDQEVVTKELLVTLDAIHCAGLVHRDLHHKNIMLGDDGIFYIIDFGSAERLTEENAKHFETWKVQDISSLKLTITKFFDLARERLTTNPN